MIKKLNKDGEVWVFAEQHNGEIAEVSLELLSKGRELADKLKVGLASILVGSNVAHLAQTLTAYGADTVYIADAPLLVSGSRQSCAQPRMSNTCFGLRRQAA